MTGLKVFLDLDCVLADFVAGALRAHGLTWDEVEPHWPQGEYMMDAAVERAHAANGGGSKFWTPINANPKFWYDLDPLPWASELVALVRSVDPNFHVVTSPSRCDFCVPGKQWWLNRLLGVEWFTRMIPTPYKELFAHVPGAVLIDDCDENLDRFRVAGGGIITFPAYHNSEWEWRADPMTPVRAALERLRSNPCQKSNRGSGRPSGWPFTTSG